MKSFSSETLNFFLQKVLFVLHFRSCQNYMSSANLVAEIHQKLCNKRVLSTGEPHTCEYVSLIQSFHRGTLSIHWYIAQNFQPTFSMFVLFRRLFKTVTFSRFSEVAIATSDFMNELYNGEFVPRQFEIMYLKRGNKKQHQWKNIYENSNETLAKNVSPK